MHVVEKTLVVIFLMFSTCLLAVTKNVPNAKIQQYIESDPDSFENLFVSVEERVNWVRGSVYEATVNQTSDNRAYALALAIDLCNSLPPDFRFPIDEELEKQRAEEEGEYYHEPYNPPPKNECINDLNNFMFPRQELTDPQEILKQNEFLWERAEKKGRLTEGYIDIKYLKLFDFKDVSIDKHGEPASMNPQDINFENPTHYQAFKEHMERFRPAMEAGIKPWEAKAFLGIEEEEPTEETVEEVEETQALEIPKPEPKVAAPKPPEPDPTDADFRQEWLWGLGVLALLVVGVGLLRRKKR